MKGKLTEHLSNQTFSFIPLNCAAEFLRGDDTEASRRATVRQQKDREVTPLKSRAAFEDHLKFWTSPNAPLFRETLRGLDASQEMPPVPTGRPRG